MASKFQNRLVGTIVLVALGVIVLPGMLDGQKKHYKDEFAAIPLVPKPGDNNEPDMLPAATQALPSQPPEGAAEEVRAGNAAAPSLDAAHVTPGGAATMPPDADVASVKPKQPDTQSPTPESATLQVRPAVRDPAPTVSKPVQPIAAPTGKAYVVQLGALKNADKVNEIVTKLRANGFRVYTSPSTPVQGSITRILVGPDTSRDKLKNALDDMNRISGLNGVIKNYSAN